MMDATFVYGVGDVLWALFLVLVLATVAFAWLDTKLRRFVRRSQRKAGGAKWWRNVWPISWWRKRRDRKAAMRATVEAYKITVGCLRQLKAEGYANTVIDGRRVGDLADMALDQSLALLRAATEEEVLL